MLLAGGSSRRFGTRDKLLAPLGCRPLLAWALAHAAASGGRLIVVVGRGQGARAALVRRLAPKARLVRAPDSKAGMARSLVAGLKAVRPVERELLLFLGDMPFAAAPRGLRLGPGTRAARPYRHGRPGHPLLVAAATAHALPLRGDRGLGALLDRRSLAQVPGGLGALLDVDTPAALSRARILLAHGRFSYPGDRRTGTGWWRRSRAGSRPSRR